MLLLLSYYNTRARRPDTTRRPLENVAGGARALPSQSHGRILRSELPLFGLTPGQALTFQRAKFLYVNMTIQKMSPWKILAGNLLVEKLIVFRNRTHGFVWYVPARFRSFRGSK